MPRKATSAAGEKAASREVKYEILDTIDVLSENQSGWRLELNVVSWNGAKPKYDLRSWNADHSRMTKGITLNAEELSVLREVIAEIDPYAIEEM